MGVRINTLKINKEKVIEVLRQNNISYQNVDWCEEALILNREDTAKLEDTDLISKGHVYRQSLSSLFVPLTLDIQPGDKVLDMCSAPGSKATQIAALLNNNGTLVCIEKIQSRYFKLRTVADLLGAQNAVLHCMDARRYRLKGEPFDKILVDAPCSSEGRFLTSNSKTFQYWSPRKIKEMSRKQKGLLLHALRLLKSGGTIVYSTCTFAPEENENVIDWLLRKGEGQLEAERIETKGIKTYSSMSEWQGKSYNKQVEKCVRILPDEKMEGFFMAKLKKI